MGHERVGILPKTKRWQIIVKQIATASNADFDTATVAASTLRNVRKQFTSLEFDPTTQAAFRFLVALAVSSRNSNIGDFADLVGGNPERATPLRVATALRHHTAASEQTPEYAEIAKDAAIDAIAKWYQDHKPQSLSLFDSFNTPLDTWRKAGDGAGFCELSRLFFSNYVERYLNYFLEREASNVLRTVEDRNALNDKIEAHITFVSQHAFETSKITQSWAAGWFNERTRQGMPTEEDIHNFLSHAFGKLRAELIREEQK